MPNRIITKSSPILIKKITSALPTNLFNKLTELNDINDSGLSETNAYLKYDSASEKFKFVSLSGLGVNSINSLSGDVTIAGAGTVSVSEAGSTITITGTGGAGGGLDSSAVSSLIDSALDVLDTHDSAAVEGQIDSAYIRPLARAAITAGSNITYDSATGTISVAASFGTHDSALVQGQIDSNLNALDTHDSAAVLGQINAKFANDATFSKDLNVDSNLTVGGYIGGPAVFTIDPAAIGDSTGKVIILGDLQVDGTQTTINSTTVSISDKNIVLADSAADASQADGAGITVNGASATIQYASTGDKWVFNKAPYYNTNRLLTAADTLDADTLGGNDSSYYLNYNNFTNTPTIPTVDSATIRPLARAALVAGSNITYDSATGVIASTAAGGTDSASVVSIADSRIGVASIGDLSDVDLTGISQNKILKWDSDNNKFVAATDATGAGGSGIALTDLSATNTAGKFGSLSYNSTSGQFTYTGPDSADVNTVINAKFANDATFSKDLNVDSNLTLGGELFLGDNKKINVGDSNDLQLYHNGSHSFIKDAGTGSLFIDGTVFIRAGSGNKYFSGEANIAKLYHTNNEKLATTATGIDVTGNIVTSGYIAGPASFTIDPAGVGDSTGKVIILGDLQVDGTTTTINSTTVSISDKNIVLADSAADSSQANGAGITVNGANATIQYTATGDKWVFNKAPYYSTNRILTTADDLHDSALVQGQIDSAVTIAFINSLSGTLDADTLGGNDSSYYLNYNNFTNKPTIPTVDSATIQPLARAAIVAGSNITYDSGTGVIAAVIGDTQDSAAVQGQIDSSINNNIVGTSNEVEVNATGGVATIGLPSAVQITTSLTVGGNAVLTTASDTHDSAAVQGQIDSAAASFLSSDSDDTMSANLTVTGTITTGSGNNTTVIKSDTATYNNYSIKHDLDGTSVTLSSTTVIDTYTHNSAKTSIEYLIHIEHNTSAETQITKILATYKGSGTDVQFTEYGEIFTGDSSLGALTVDENAGSIRLLLDPRGSEDVISKVVRTVII